MDQSRFNGENAEPLNAPRMGKFEIVPLNRILASPYQAKSKVTIERVERLAASIERHGLLAPILLVRLQNGYFRHLAGLRRKSSVLVAGYNAIGAMVWEEGEIDEASVFAEEHDTVVMNGKTWAESIGLGLPSDRTPVRERNASALCDASFSNGVFSVSLAKEGLDAGRVIDATWNILSTKRIENRPTQKQIGDWALRYNQIAGLKKQNKETACGKPFPVPKLLKAIKNNRPLYKK